MYKQQRDGMAEKDRILVLNVDRDDDLGRKAGMSGPVLGREGVVKAATALAVADPEESDANAMFQAVRLYDEMRKKHRTEVAVLTGDRAVGIESDRNIAGQFAEILKKWPADYVVFVTDGSEDDHVLPIIQSRVPILSVNRVIVRQAEQLESTYYKIKDFVKDSMEDPRMSRLIFGLPAVVFIIYALFGIEGWRAILGVVGIYLFIKGFSLDDYVIGAVDELRVSLARRRFAFFAYIVGIAFAVLASYRGYTASLEWLSIGLFEALSSFMASSIYLYFMSVTVAWLGRELSMGNLTRSKMVSVPLFGFAVSLVVFNSSQLILSPEVSALNFLLSIFIGFGMLFLALVLEWKY